MFSKAGSGLKQGRPPWQRLLSTRRARLCIAAVGCVALVTYIWVVFFIHPAHLASSMSSELRIGESIRRTTAAVSTSPALIASSPKSPKPSSSSSPLITNPPPSPEPEPPRPMRHFPHKDEKYRIWKLPATDTSPRCKQTGICDGKYDCGADGLGCVQDALQRKNKVREAARWTWKGYRQFAWGHDELNAGSRDSREWFNLGLTIVDSLDTLQILGMMEEYAEARYWVANHLDLNKGDVSVFETTIRILGGLAAAYYHSGGDELFLVKAVEFAERLLPAFNTSSGLPQPHFSIHDKDVARYQGRVGTTCLAEAATVSMEFSAVTRISGRPEFREVAMVPWYKLNKMSDFDGLYCTMLNGDSMSCDNPHYTFGAAADSAYEYMLKQWILSNRSDQMCIDMYKKALRGMRKHMLTQLWMGEEIGDVWIVAENSGGTSKSLILEHLTCFLPGTMTLGHMYGINTALNAHDDDDLTIAIKLMKACYELYHQAASGVAYDSVTFSPRYSNPSPTEAHTSAQAQPSPSQLQSQSQNTNAAQVQGGGHQTVTAGAHGDAKSRRRLLQQGSNGRVKYVFDPRSRDNFLRPEVAESLFYLWRATGDPIYREWGWNMFRAYEHWCRVETGGYQTLSNVDMVPPDGANKMESFWMAETMKYFYLLFSDDPNEVPFDEFVFNTEAHPLAIWGSKTDVMLREAYARLHGGNAYKDGTALERLTKLLHGAGHANRRLR